MWRPGFWKYFERPGGHQEAGGVVGEVEGLEGEGLWEVSRVKVREGPVSWGREGVLWLRTCWRVWVGREDDIFEAGLCVEDGEDKAVDV